MPRAALPGHSAALVPSAHQCRSRPSERGQHDRATLQEQLASILKAYRMYQEINTDTEHGLSCMAACIAVSFCDRTHNASQVCEGA